ncbi:MAG: PorT family protein [Prevotella sp.]|nr:PorT family protein [Prevotella sp.]
MRKIFLLIGLVVASISAKAQYEPGTFSIQPKVGVTASWMSNMPDLPFASLGFEKDIKSSPTGGAVVGAEFEYQAAKWLGLTAGVSYAMQGSGWEDTDLKLGGSTVKMRDAKIETGYINLPVVANFYLCKGLALKTGVQFGFMTNAKVKVSLSQSSGSTNQKTEYDEDMKDECEKFDISIPVGLSYEFNNHLVLDARYNIGLTKVNKESLQGEDDSKNGVFQLTIGYKIKL